jgi:hypothetical protein
MQNESEMRLGMSRDVRTDEAEAGVDYHDACRAICTKSGARFVVRILVQSSVQSSS